MSLFFLSAPPPLWRVTYLVDKLGKGSEHAPLSQTSLVWRQLICRMQTVFTLHGVNSEAHAVSSLQRYPHDYFMTICSHGHCIKIYSHFYGYPLYIFAAQRNGWLEAERHWRMGHGTGSPRRVLERSRGHSEDPASQSPLVRNTELWQKSPHTANG